MTRFDHSIRLTWLGHATTLIELDGARVLTDPVLRDRIGPLTRTAPPVASAAAERVDAVLLSHLHHDHADLPSLMRLGAATPVIAPRGSGSWLRRQGLEDVRELGAGQSVSIGSLEVTATEAVHDGRRHPLGTSADAVGFVVSGSCAVYFAGDTDLFPAMSDLAGSLDAALLPVAGWGRTLGPGHLDAERAAIAAILTAPRLAIPIHWGTVAPRARMLRARDPLSAPREFAALVARYAPTVEVRVLAPGEGTAVAAREAAATP
ncbi:MAG TPA: MBL fold metallo-hydrolase [Thermoleophilaceae bacterium]|nr:MBL fold metallo-hydrolase [Thermoleophilaceae bacterium]